MPLSQETTLREGFDQGVFELLSRVRPRLAFARVDKILPELQPFDSLLPAQDASFLRHLQLLLRHADTPAKPLGHVPCRDTPANLPPIPGDLLFGRDLVQIL